MKLPNFFKHEKGFTLIELLVVIAVLGILASVVLVAINPSERINEANDAGVKNGVSQVATGIESYYTNNSGSYTGVTAATLVSQGYLKRAPDGVTLTVNAGGTNAVVYGALASATAACPAGQTGTKRWVYRPETGQSAIECNATAPTPN